MIGLLNRQIKNCPIKNCPITTWQVELVERGVLKQSQSRMISENKETNAPITLEEIVMVMINNGNRFEWNPIRSVIIRVESNSVCNHSSD